MDLDGGYPIAQSHSHIAILFALLFFSSGMSPVVIRSWLRVEVYSTATTRDLTGNDARFILKNGFTHGSLFDLSR